MSDSTEGPSNAAAVERHTPDEIRILNRAAAVFDGVIATSLHDAKVLAKALFAIAGNPMPGDEAPKRGASLDRPMTPSERRAAWQGFVEGASWMADPGQTLQSTSLPEIEAEADRRFASPLPEERHNG